MLRRCSDDRGETDNRDRGNDPHDAEAHLHDQGARYETGAV